MDDRATRESVPEPDRQASPDGFVVLADQGDRIHFLDWGGPRNRHGCLLVHGLAGTAWVWTPVTRRLRTVCHTVAIDLRGHGLSDAPTTAGAYELGRYVDDIVAVAEGSGLVPMPGFGAPDTDRPGGEQIASPGGGDRSPAGRRVVLAGHGFGASLAALAAARLAQRCAGLVLVDGGWSSLADATGLSPEEFLATIEEPPEVLLSMTAYLDDRRDFDLGTWDADQEQAARAAVAELPVGRVVPVVRPHALEGAVRAAFAYEPLDVLPAVSAPIVALAAADDEEAISSRGLARVEAALASIGRMPLRVERHPGLGHNLMRYRPEAVTRAILEVGNL